MAESLSPALASWLQEFVKLAATDEVVEAFVERVDAAVLDQTPQLAGDPILTEDLHKSTRAQWRAFVGLLGDDYRMALPSQAVDLALSLVRRGHDLVVLLKIYRVAQQSVFQFFNEFIEPPEDGGPPRDEVLVYMWGRAGTWIDDAIETLIEAFVAERQRLDAGAIARRSEQIEVLLGDVPPAGSDLSAILGHALHHWQTGYVVWSPDVAASTTFAIQQAAGSVAELLGAPPPLTHVAGSREVWCWAATPTAPDTRALAALEPELAQAGLHVALGFPAPGVPGFRTSHREARAAQGVALAATGVPALISYEDVEILCLVSGAEDGLRRMIARELGGLVAADKNLALVRETVLTYLETFNVEATAERLFVHKNTVRYRLAKAEELLGHPLTERSLYVGLALRWVARFGSPAEPA